MVGLGDGRAEALLQLRLQGLQLLALALERSALREVQVNLDDGDVAQLLERALDLGLLVHLDHVALLDVHEVLERDAALEPARTSRTSSLKRRSGRSGRRRRPCRRARGALHAARDVPSVT